MPSTYSPDLRIELIGPGEQAGTWSSTTNTNLGTIVEDAISGYSTVSVTSANQAFTANNGVADQARNATIALTTTTTANFAVYAPPTSKQYIISNTTAYVATIYNSTVMGNTTPAGTGVAIPAGKKLVVFSNGTNFSTVEAANLTGVLAVANGGTGVTTSTGIGSTVLSNSPTLVTPALGTPSALVGTNITGTALGLDIGFQQVGTGAVTRTAQDKMRDTASVKDFGAVGDGVTDDTVAVQAAIDAICNAQGILLFPPGSYVISASLTFPNKSFVIRGSGPTATSISEIPGSGQIKLFDLSGTNGPSVVIEQMGFFGPTGGPGYGGDGLYFSASNGVSVVNCWFGGLLNGVNKANDSSYVRLLDCTFEYCFSAVTFDQGVQCIVDNTTFYRNTLDYNLKGACSLGLFTNSTHAETINTCVFLNGVRDAIIENVTCRQDFDTRVPSIVKMVNSCQRNILRNIRSYNFGSTLITLSNAASNNNNLFDGLYFTIAPVISPSLPLPAGTGGTGIEIGASNQGNTFSNFNFISISIGIVEAAGGNRFVNGLVNNSGTAGILIQNASDSEFVGITLVNNNIDWSTAGAVNTVWLTDINGTVNGLTPQRFGSRGVGAMGRLFYGTTAPPLNTLPYGVGDRILNINPVVAQPKAWTCTVAGTPGTWVSEGTL